jgi:hypothetical protein
MFVGHGPTWTCTDPPQGCSIRGNTFDPNGFSIGSNLQVSSSSLPGVDFASGSRMASIKFQSLEDGELADIWYALGGSAARHPDHFKRLMDEVFAELESRREQGLNPWLEQRFRPFRFQDSKEDAEANTRSADE